MYTYPQLVAFFSSFYFLQRQQVDEIRKLLKDLSLAVTLMNQLLRINATICDTKNKKGFSIPDL